MKIYLNIMLVLLFMLNLYVFDINQATAGEKPVKIVVGTTFGPTHPFADLLKKINEKLKEAGSSVTLDIQLSGILGGERELAESVMFGTTDACVIADMSLSVLDQRVLFTNFPGMFKNYDAVQANYYNGWAGEKFKQLVAAKNISVLVISDNDFRTVTNSKRPITKLDDLKGLKLRVPEISFLIDFFQEVGVLATPIAIGELLTALQQKVVDGQELGPTVVYSFGYYPFQKYQAMTNHSYSAEVFLINTEKLNSLTKKQRNELEGAADYAAAYYWDLKQKFMADAITKMKAAGCEFIEPSPEFQKEILEVGKKLARSDKYSKLFGEELVNKMYPE